MPNAPAMPAMPDPSNPGAMPPTTGAAPPQTDTPAPADDTKKKEPKPGDFNAGGQLRFPNGPDEMGEFKSFNWVAFDAKGTYYLLPTVFATATIPFAAKRPETVGPMGPEPSLVGGMHLKLDASIPKLPKLPGIKYETSAGLQLGLAYMREGALLLSEKDYPLFLGDFQPGATVGLLTRIKLSSAVDFNFNPVVLLQKGEAENLSAIQIPLSLVLAAGQTIKLGLETSINTGDDFSFGGSSGGRISLGTSLDLKISKILVHLGTGMASLLTGGLYPEISDSIYFELNVKYAK
jgi:hypothetical protein